MATNRVVELAQVLRRLAGDEDPEKAKKEAENLVRSITPQELSLAEQQLIREGVDPQVLRHLCEVHLRVLSDEVARFRTALPAAHPLDTLMAEHQVILKTLGELEEVNRAVQQADALDAERDERLKRIATLLVDAEPHHQREEQALFPEVERRGVTGPPRIMRMEHVELRQRKHALLELAEAAATMPYADFKKRLNELAGYVVFNLRDHIFKEDNILYPTAAQVIADPAVWEAIKARSDEIGYCSFTPTGQS